MMTRDELYELIGYDDYAELDHRLTRTTEGEDGGKRRSRTPRREPG